MALKQTTQTATPDTAPVTAQARKKMSFEDMLTPAQDFIGANSTNVLLVGVLNSKKTLSLNTIPDEWEPWDGSGKRPFRVLYLNADDRASVIDWSKRPNWSVINLPLEYSDPKQIVDLHKDILDNLKRTWNPTTRCNDRFDAVIYDSLTPLDMNLRNFTWQNVAPGERGTGKGKEKVPVAMWSNGYEGNEDRYGTIAHMLEIVIYGLRDSVQFFFAIAHEKAPHYSEKDGKYAPNITGGLKHVLPSLFHEVYYTTQYRGDWMWLTQPYDSRVPRTCYPLPMRIPMDWSVIIDRRWRELYDPEADAKYKAEKAAEEEREREEIKLAIARAKAAEQEDGDN